MVNGFYNYSGPFRNMCSRELGIVKRSMPNELGHQTNVRYEAVRDITVNRAYIMF